VKEYATNTTRDMNEKDATVYNPLSPDGESKTSVYYTRKNAGLFQPKFV